MMRAMEGFDCFRIFAATGNQNVRSGGKRLNKSTQARRKMIQLPWSSPACIALRPELRPRAVSFFFFLVQNVISLEFCRTRRNAAPITLLGDTTGNGLVNSSDISDVQAQSGQPPTASNLKEDVTLNGAINSSDISLVQAQSGTGLPAPPSPSIAPTENKRGKKPASTARANGN
jgi:hypothetical protein